MLLEKLHRHKNDIVKIQRIVVFQAGLILYIAPGNVQSPQITAGFRPFQHFLRGHHLVLLPADRAKNIFCREGLVIESHVLDDILHNPLGIRCIIDGKAAGIAHFSNVTPQNPAASGVEGHCPDILSLGAKKCGQSITDFVRCLIGKSDGQNAPWNCRFHSAKTFRTPAVIFSIRLKGFKKSDVFF